jgi:outer membrane protein assembly factor BamB
MLSTRKSALLASTVSAASLALLGPMTVASCSSSSNGGSGGAGASPDASTVADAGPQPPFAAGSPWPKFRRDAIQDGVSPVHASMTGGALWSYQTGKGIFSSPVVGADGTIYVGSADRTFYALHADGTLAWSLLTGEIIDSAALLDDQGNVYFGSGDGNLRALNAKTGAPVWSFAADDPSVNSAYINWFEGNVALGMDGNLYAPNDDYFVYAVDRANGAAVWKYKMPDQTWSLPAVDPATGILYVGNNETIPLLGENTFAIEPDGGGIWSASTIGTVAASPVIAGTQIIVGAFDGYLHSYDATLGIQNWQTPARDHIYGSASLLADGTIVVPSADGSLYAMDPKTGAQKWEFDTTQPIRSSPAVDADGNIYFGDGDGRLYVVGSDGTLRWSMLLISADRNDLNASPALTNDSIILAGESGQVFSVPYEYCLRPEGKADVRCSTTMPTLPNGASLVWTTSFGNALAAPPAAIDPTTPIVLSLVVRQAGNAQLAIMDAANVKVTLDPPSPVDVVVSGDGKFMTVAPTTVFQPGANGTVSITVSAPYLTGMTRNGLKLSGGTQGGTATLVATPTVNAAGTATLSPATTWEVTRLSVPLPTIMASYNQIGFDSLTYLIGLAELDTASNQAVAWMVGGKLDAQGNASVDPTSEAIFPLAVTIDGAALTMSAIGGIDVQVTSLDVPFSTFRMDLQTDALGENVPAPASLIGSTQCASVPTYGVALSTLGLCNPQTGAISFAAAANVLYHGAQSAPSGAGLVTFAATSTSVTATLTSGTLVAADHLASVLLVDPTTNVPVSLGYALNTTRATAADGVTLASVTVPFNGATVPSSVRAYLMIDTVAAAKATLTIP